VVADLDEVFDRSSRCVLGFSGRRGPVLSPMAFWSDGSSLWMSTPAVSVKARALLARPDCAVYVPGNNGGPGAVARGRARIFGLHDPLGLAVHGPLVTTAMGMLASRNAGTILGYVQDARAVPSRFRPRNRVAVRLKIDDVLPVADPEPAAGIAPALPTVVSPEVRRALAGRRTVTVAVEQPGVGLWLRPAVWGAGFELDFQDRDRLLSGAPAAVHVGTDPGNRPTSVVGLSLFGEIDGGRLRPSRATWWEGFDLTTVELAAAPASITLPD
jgi:Pyridoxamine 5'-phosphate oxidase